MCVVAYVSGHGLGHSAREVTILRELPVEIPLIVKTAAPEWFWRSVIQRPFTLLADAFDVGCLQTDSVTVDPVATKAAWEACDARNALRRDEERRWLESVGARVVLTDVASFPLTLGWPSVCVANFTWADIYAEYAGFEAIVAQLEAEYAQATLLLDADLSLPMPYFPRRETIGLVARVSPSVISPCFAGHLPASRPSSPDRSQARWEEGLIRNSSLDPLRADTPALASEGDRGNTAKGVAVSAAGGCIPEQRTALIYGGNWGMPFPWETLERFDNWQFVTLTAPPEPWPRNLTALSPDALPHEQLVASVDVVISKAGYGLTGECMAAGTPLLYGPREGFAEFAALDAALLRWDGGLRLESEAFLAAQWPLEKVPLKGSVSRLPAPGAAKAIAHLVALWQR